MFSETAVCLEIIDRPTFKCENCVALESINTGWNRVVNM